MNTDIRLSVNFFSHLKTLKLERRCGKEAVLCLLKLWVWAAVNQPSGDLSGYCSEDLELFSGWTGERGEFARGLRDIGWLDGEERAYHLHGWGEFQTWVTGTARREDIARLGALASKNRAAYERLKAKGVKGITKEEYAEYLHWTSGFSLSCAPAPAPAPAPSPSPSPAPKKKHRGAEKPKDQKPKDQKPKDDTGFRAVSPEFKLERKWNGVPFKRASPLDYIRKIQEIAAQAPKFEPLDRRRQTTQKEDISNGSDQRNETELSEYERGGTTEQGNELQTGPDRP